MTMPSGLETVRILGDGFASVLRGHARSYCAILTKVCPSTAFSESVALDSAIKCLALTVLDGVESVAGKPLDATDRKRFLEEIIEAVMGAVAVPMSRRMPPGKTLIFIKEDRR